MSQQDDTLNTEPTAPDCPVAPPSVVADEVDNVSSLSVVDDDAADRKSGSGGLDSLGGGRLP